MKLFVVKDMKANLWHNPFVERSTVAALRGWEIAVNESESIYKKFPSDFRLYELAFFDETTGTLEPLATAVDLGGAHDVIRHKGPNSEPALPLPSRHFAHA